MQSHFVLVLAYGTVGHLLQLVRFNPYPALPDWLRTYFTDRAGSPRSRSTRASSSQWRGLGRDGARIRCCGNGWASYALDDAVGITTGCVGDQAWCGSHACIVHV